MTVKKTEKSSVDRRREKSCKIENRSRRIEEESRIQTTRLLSFIVHFHSPLVLSRFHPMAWFRFRTPPDAFSSHYMISCIIQSHQSISSRLISDHSTASQSLLSTTTFLAVSVLFTLALVSLLFAVPTASFPINPCGCKAVLLGFLGFLAITRPSSLSLSSPSS